METLLASLKKACLSRMPRLEIRPEGLDAPAEVKHGWQAVLSSLVRQAHSDKVLLELARSGLAARLHDRPQLQAEVVTYVDALIRDTTRTAKLWHEYARSNFGHLDEEHIRPLALEPFLPRLGFLFARQPGLAILLLVCHKRSGVAMFQSLNACARYWNRPELARLVDTLRKDQARQIFGLFALLDVWPLKSWALRLLSRLLLFLWYAGAAAAVTGSLEPGFREALEAIKMDITWYRARITNIFHFLVERYTHPIPVAVHLKAEQQWNLSAS